MARKKKINVDQLAETIAQLDVSEQVQLLKTLKDSIASSLAKKQEELADLNAKFNQ
jgi:hypothetical protein